MKTVISPVITTLSYISNTRLANGITGSKSNISAHYDLSNDVFSAFLSWDMTYSCAVFDEEAKGYTGDLIENRPIAPPRKDYHDPRTMPADDLERGQLKKLHLIAQRARIKEGSHVLEIGCGWGSFAILAAGAYGATVEAITISDVQKEALDKNIFAAGLSERIKVHVMDYRNMPESFHHAFDAVVSIGVMEHVGIEFMPSWFKQMSWAMKEQNAVKVFTMSTVPDSRWHLYSSGGQLSSIKTLVNDITSAGLNIESIENIGPHYARTLREWSYRFQRNFDSHILPALKSQYLDLTADDLEIFRKKWIYYFAYSEAGFAMNSISDSVFVVTREVVSD
ncbi:S-adenosyl-L-methionine-dependent methyltransferase [Dendrothele bispora CBS 962.96]|uniref:S-adenosyl-L-methionine-dependent methyltransferase n=1 Tax=Dendrothele bispora (strain CBS 962.96) TaxID=1314807 RepID=A0A4S8LD35_DENBC|nr:S-adenosyl-L-methionine-dependent methyltransferase [Dendrothele bispora CBS 962.96]